MSRHIMIDLETIGLGPRSAIAAIGAVEFDPLGQGFVSELYLSVDLRTSVAASLAVDPETVVRLANQSGDARVKPFPEGSLPLYEALFALSQRISGPDLRDEDAIVWANGASLDFLLLDKAYRAVELKLPWKICNERDWRALQKVGPDIEVEPASGRRNALSGARRQALHLQLVMAHLHRLDVTDGI